MLVQIKPALMKDRLFVHPQEERARLDAKLFQTLGQLCAVHLAFFREYDSIHPVSAARPGFLDGQRQTLYALQPSRILMAYTALACDDLADAFHLCYAERRLQIRQSEICAQLFVIETTLGL